MEIEFSVSAKIRTLSEFQVRISTNQQSPSNAEIITTLRYFQQTLIGFLKDFPAGNTHFCEKFSTDPARFNLFPNLNYSGLYYAIVNLLDVFPMIASGQAAIGEAILDTMKALLIFLDRDSLEQVPLLLASQLGVFPTELDRNIVHMLADVVLPYSVCEETLVHLSIPGVLMLVLQYGNDPSLHTWITEGAMNCCEDVYHHLLQVIAKGTSESRVAAANLLFHYWPFPNPHILHRKTIQYKLHAWQHIPCQSNTCAEKGPAAKRCFDSVVCTDISDTSPPLFLCKRCSDDVIAERKVQTQTLTQPMPASNATCQNKDCQSQSRLAVGICFSHECIRPHNHVPMRLCQECFMSMHEDKQTKHMTHKGIGCVWNTVLQWDTVESIVKLLRETTLFEVGEAEGKRPKWLRQLEGGHSMGKEIDKMADERRMLSRFGVWLMAALCPPVENADRRAIAYIMQNVFQWFSTTALLPNDSMGASLEQLKTDFACDWINMAIRIRYDVFIETLSPRPQDQDGRPPLDQTKEGLGRLLALMPYDVISMDTWSRIMPIWLQYITENCKEEHQSELKVLMCKIFEPDLCPLPFDIHKVFDFINCRLIGNDYNELFNALQWLHQLSRLEIAIPLDMILDNFSVCLTKLPTMHIPPLEDNDLEEEEISAHVVVTDILVLQLRLSEVAVHELSSLTEKLFGCIALLLSCPIRAGPHQCHDPELDGFPDCSPCQQAAFVQQMIMQVTESVSPKQETAIQANEDQFDILDDTSSPTLGDSSILSPQTAPGSGKGLSPANPVQPLLPSDNSGSLSSGMRFQTAKVEVDQAGDEFVDVLPEEELEIGLAEAVTLTASDIGIESGQAVKSTTVEGIKGQLTPMSASQSKALGSVTTTSTDFWDTSVGRFRFTFDQLPSQLKMIHALLLSLDSAEDPDVEYFTMNTLKYLCLHCNALANARREFRGYVIWTLENLMVPKLWARLRSDFVQVGELASLLLLHCITFPSGEDQFWRMVHRDFTSRQWEKRFDAVGKAYVMAHMTKAAPVKANKVVQTALSSVFYHLVISLHDPTPSVAQRAIIALRALPTQTLKLICFCFESQFDSCILDRPLLINAIRILTNQLPEEQTLTFDFFIQRFETLAIEAQMSSQSEENMFVQDLMHTDPMSDIYQRKLTKARRAIEDAQTARSIVKHLREYEALKHQLFHLPSDPVLQLCTRLVRWRQRGRLSEAALSCRVKILKVVTMVRVVNRWRQMADSIALGTAGLVSLIATSGHALHYGQPALTPTAADTTPVGQPINTEPEERPENKPKSIADVTSPSSVTSPTSYGAGGYSRLREFTDEESNLCLLFNRVVDMENPERHTVYLVISLFVNFLSNKHSTPTDEKANAKKQSLLFRLFNTLLGYSNTEKCFTIPPARLRKSAVCNAFLSGLPEIFDLNLIIGNQLLPTVVQLLMHLPSPQKLASDQNVSNYSLKLLSAHMRHLWLNSFILILYKYRFDQVPISDGVMKLISIVVKTLESQAHVCCPEAEQPKDISIWEDLQNGDDNDDEEERGGGGGGLIRPESLTVTTIQENDGEITLHPKIVEPRTRKRSGGAKKKQNARPAQNVDLRCGHCNEVLEWLDEETISLCLVSLETFLHREPAMAAPILFKVLHTVTRLIDHPIYPWHDTDTFVPGNCRSVAKQMLRVTLHQLSSCGICFHLFDTPLSKPAPFWSVISLSLADFPDLSPVYFIQLLLEDLQENWPPKITTIMRNLAAYIVEVPSDSYMNHWNNVIVHMETFFRKYHTQITTEGAMKPNKVELESAIIVMSHLLKVQNFSAFKSAVSMVEAFSKWLAEALHDCPIRLEALLTVCTACNRALIRERDKQCITRAVVAELMQAIKFKCTMHLDNYMTIANMILQDAGEDIDVPLLDDQFNTAASEAVRPFLFEILDFIADLHVLAKLKKETNSDAIGGDLKVKLAEAIAAEMSRSTARDCRTVIRFIPWLMSPPSVTQAAPGAFADSVTNVRVLSWLLLGALHANHACLPVPIECSQHMADYIHFVLAGFADQSKQSVVHMSALFHAFHLCQLWTVYCERAAVFSSTTAFAHLLDFWARVTPAILQLLSHSKVLADMVNLHFLNTIQALQQVNSALLCQLYSMWAPILTAYHSQIPSQLRMKLDSCENQPSLDAPILSEWLKKVRYKISQVELQTSAASPYYNV
ncbi:hypothetical protein WR25_22228 [Diploscapter pachys]|uniref:Uncoordinated protein 79 n=1 Tax=Diploscapter pachys TaxID=2018661 RepID=A0A2A2L5P8_9BILA|nr:hypothetical protein WR25_22228 [Diploscapter pachys]